MTGFPTMSFASLMAATTLSPIKHQFMEPVMRPRLGPKPHGQPRPIGQLPAIGALSIEEYLARYRGLKIHLGSASWMAPSSEGDVEMTTDENNGNGHDAQLPLPMTPAVNIPTEPTTRKERMRFRQRRPRVICKICRHIYFFRTSIDDRTNPRAMTLEQQVIRARKHGWRVSDDMSEALCLECWRDTSGLTRSKYNDERSLEKAMVTIPGHKNIVTRAPVPPEPDKPTKQRIHRRLIEVHDGTAGYTGVYTDRMVAEELGVAQAVVEKIRQEWFGPAGNDHLLAEVAAIGVKLGELTECCDRLRERLAEVEHKLGVL